MYDKIEWLGATGEPDILAHNLDKNELYVLSLKNYEIKKKPFLMNKESLQSEYKKAFNSQFDYDKVKLFLVVFNNVNDSIIKNELDYKNPTDIYIN